MYTHTHTLTHPLTHTHTHPLSFKLDYTYFDSEKEWKYQFKEKEMHEFRCKYEYSHIFRGIILSLHFLSEIFWIKRNTWVQSPKRPLFLFVRVINNFCVHLNGLISR